MKTNNQRVSQLIDITLCKDCVVKKEKELIDFIDAKKPMSHDVALCPKCYENRLDLWLGLGRR